MRDFGVFLAWAKGEWEMTIAIFNKTKVRSLAALLQDTDAFFLEILNAAHNCLVLIDVNTKRIVYANEACEKLYGYNQDELFGMPAMAVITDDEADWQSYLQQVLEAHPGDYNHQNSHEKKDGNVFTAEVISKLLIINKRRYILCHITDITRDKKRKGQIKKLIQDLSYRAHRDYLTGVYNRGYLFDVYMKRITGRDVGVMLLDIDDFKPINDYYGHQVGDLILVEIAKIIASHIRQEDKVIRLGGDEFMIVVPDISQDALAEMAKRIEKHIAAREFIHAGQVINCTVSIGMAIGKAYDDKQMDDLIKQADDDLYYCKRADKAREV